MEPVILAVIGGLFLVGAMGKFREEKALRARFPRRVVGEIVGMRPEYVTDTESRYVRIWHKFIWSDHGTTRECEDVAGRAFKLGRVGGRVVIYIGQGSGCVPGKALMRGRMIGAVLALTGVCCLAGACLVFVK